ncbi:hypothetical protein LT350_29120 [Mycolicibacterium smegmatis]|uniref:hypothetical protein n=1 Tax=Mycolicibacterium smegmatis TaxID=1772 RepID=UPI001E4AF91E|nr:hypothetical protein [Mycolicibacterium smegmatis]UGU30539.1 hypothetical protein LT350_29120 [Mycolicibacterium smegmatis]ULN71460.1 hypothetical protein KZ782_05915 [Mycolicibacterium smegmatis]
MKKRWNDLSPTAKAAVIGVAAVDAGLRAWALRDLAGRDANQVRGPKKLWSVALGLVTSGGMLPALYLVAGRKS